MYDIKLTPQLLVEASNKISSFQARGEEAVKVQVLPKGERQALSFPTDSDNMLAANQNLLKVMTLICMMIIHHANDQITMVADDEEVVEFIKFFAQETNAAVKESEGPKIATFEEDVFEEEQNGK